MKANVHALSAVESSRILRLGVAMVCATKKRIIVVITLNCILNWQWGDAKHHGDYGRTYIYFASRIFTHGANMLSIILPTISK